MVEIINKIFEFLFGWAVDPNNTSAIFSPLFGIIFISFILSAISSLSWKFLTDQDVLKALREKNTKMREELKKYKDDAKKVAELNAKMAKDALEDMKTQYKQSLKPMIVTLVPFALAFIWIRKTYEPLGHIFFTFGGIGTYIIFSIVFSMIIRKVMKVY